MSAGSVGALAILGGTADGDAPRDTSQKKIYQDWGMDKEMMVSSLQPPHYALSLLDKDSHNSLKVEGQIGDKSCLVTVDTRASVTIARPDIRAGLPQKDPPMKCILQMASGETLPILKEVLVTLTLWWRPLTTWCLLLK
jgi:hypothetical protein